LHFKQVIISLFDLNKEIKNKINLHYVFSRVIRGGNGLVDGPVLPENLAKAMKKVDEQGFANKPQVGMHASCKMVIVLIPVNWFVQTG